MDVKAIYKIPALKHAFIIVSSLDEFSENSSSFQESRTRTEYLERILRSKNCTQPKAIRPWTLKVMSQSDFLLALRRHKPTLEVLPSQTSYDDPELELLAINLVKTESGLEQKELSFTEEADIIEVFI